MYIGRLSAAVLLATALAACSATPETGQGAKENTGTLIGALTGGFIGSQFGGGTGERIAAGVAGAAIGGLIGNRIGASMDDEDKQRAYAAQVQALENGRSGAAVAWKNPDLAAMEPLFREQLMRRMGYTAARTRTRSTSTDDRKWPVGARAATRTGPGRRSLEAGAASSTLPT